MKNLIIAIFLIFTIQIGLAFASNDWLVREIKHTNIKVEGIPNMATVLDSDMIGKPLLFLKMEKLKRLK